MFRASPWLAEAYASISVDEHFRIVNAIPALPRVQVATRPSEREKTVLIVDDFPPLRDLVARHLSSSGYSVITASDALEARRITRFSRGRTIDLLLADHEMPATTSDELHRDVAGLELMAVELAAKIDQTKTNVRDFRMAPRFCGDGKKIG